MRRSRTSSLKGKGLGSIPNTIPISERPPEAVDRAIPGHWEGDLIQGSKNSYIITLVERHSRFVMLAKIRDNKTITVISALIRQARELPAELYKTLTWDRGAEMTSHTRFTIATDIQIYFCDPQSPGNVAQMKIRTDCSDNIFQKELTYRFTASKDLTVLPDSSTKGREKR